MRKQGKPRRYIMSGKTATGRILQATRLLARDPFLADALPAR